MVVYTEVGDSETDGLWSEFIAFLKERGLTGVKLVVSDAHVGLTKATCRQKGKEADISAQESALNSESALQKPGHYDYNLLRLMNESSTYQDSQRSCRNGLRPSSSQIDHTGPRQQ